MKRGANREGFNFDVSNHTDSNLKDGHFKILRIDGEVDGCSSKEVDIEDGSDPYTFAWILS